jgi:hypothetical protein
MSYNRTKVMRALTSRAIKIVREGGGHTIVESPAGQSASIPRHAQLDRWTVRKVVKQLGLNWNDVKKDIS